MHRAMAKSRTAKVALFRLVEQSSLPIYLVADDLSIAFGNLAMCQWTGQDLDFLTTLKCIYHSGVDLTPTQQLAAGLCPPPTAFHGHREDGFVFVRRENSTEFRQAWFQPLPDNEPGRCPVLVVVHGHPVAAPPGQLTNQSDNASLHAAIAQMQYEAASRVNMDLVVGNSPQSRKIRKQIDVASQTAANVLIVGPPGSGRRQIAELIHFAQGPQQAGPLIPIDGTLSDAEIVQRTVKSLYRNSKLNPDEPLGRLMLLDLDKMPAAAQSEIVGFSKLPDFRLPMIGTCTVLDKTIRDDLLNEIATLTIRIPDLIDRRQDLPLLIHALVEEYNVHAGTSLAGFETQAVDMLIDYPWPGDFFELKETVESACAAASAPIVGVDDLPHHFRLAVRSLNHQVPGGDPELQLDQLLADIELELIQRAMAHAQGNKSQAAKLLGISRARLIRRLSDHSSQVSTDDSKGIDDAGGSESNGE